MSEKLREQVLAQVQENGPTTCPLIAGAIGTHSRTIAPILRALGNEGLITQTGLTSSNAIIWSAHRSRVDELMQRFITQPAGAAL